MAIAYKVTKKAAVATKKPKATAMSAPTKLQLLFTIVNRNKTEFYTDLLQNFDINMQMILSAKGTAGSERMALLGLEDDERSVILSVIRKDRAKEALALLEDKFKTVKNGRGIAYTVPMSSIIGVAIYQFLCNNPTK